MGGGPINTLLIDGVFEELADELSQYIDNVQKNNNGPTTTQTDVAALLKAGKKDDALKKLVTSAEVLNNAPEKEFIPAYGLLIHLIQQSPNPNLFLSRVCGYLQRPIASSSQNGTALALVTLTNVFNIMKPDNDARYHVFLAILKVVKQGGSYEVLKPQLKNLDIWFKDWEMDEEDQQKLLLLVSEAAEEAGESDDAYYYLLKALRTTETSEIGTDESRKLSLRALNVALSNPSHFDFQDLISLDSIQALRKSDPVAFELLELFNAETLDDLFDFREAHEKYFSSQSLDEEVLVRKMRLLTLASLAASTPSKSLPYADIVKALQIPTEDVETWIIDVIRAGLVEGKMSQLEQTFLIHRSSYRVFGEKQWREVATRLETWKDSLRGVLEIIRRERENTSQGPPKQNQNQRRGGRQQQQQENDDGD
ncbi:MAG: hypothetical protein M1814_003873 [Vezdaea aestivalis]|nr:MAG: hypothetical protein M1814_003873 [Vezdaea aestivalis]